LNAHFRKEFAAAPERGCVEDQSQKPDSVLRPTFSTVALLNSFWTIRPLKTKEVRTLIRTSFRIL